MSEEGLDARIISLARDEKKVRTVVLKIKSKEFYAQLFIKHAPDFSLGD